MSRRFIYNNHKPTGSVTLSGGTYIINGGVYPSEPTSGYWVVPENLVSFTIECYGSGSIGDGTRPGYGGGAGAYSKTTTSLFNKNQVLTWFIGTFSPNTSTQVYSGATIYCKAAAHNSQAGGIVANCIGDVKIAGANGANPSGPNGGAGGNSPGPLGATGGAGGVQAGDPNGANGGSPGAGGGGAANYVGSTYGKGGYGKIILTYTYFLKL